MTAKERVMAAYDVTQRAVGVETEVIQKVEAVIYIMADKFLDSAEMKQLKEEIKMTRLGQMLYYDGVADGRTEGRAEGERLHLFYLIQKKVAKGKSVEVIAEEIEADVETVAGIIKEMNG